MAGKGKGEKGKSKKMQHAVYQQQNRRETNKKRRMEREAMRILKKASRITTPRGTARANRRKK
jgi:hypothetical protein